MLYLLRYPAYNDVYAQTADRRTIKDTIGDMQQTWEKLNAAAEAEGMSGMHRDGHCHEAVMWFTHHLEEDAKRVLNAQGVVLPLLSAARHVCPESPTEAQAAVCKEYDYKVSCSDCHSKTPPAPPPTSFLAAAARRLRALF